MAKQLTLNNENTPNRSANLIDSVQIGNINNISNKFTAKYDEAAIKIKAYVDSYCLANQNNPSQQHLVKTSQLAFQISKENYFDNASAVACLALPLLHQKSVAWEKFLTDTLADIIPILKAYQMMRELKDGFSYSDKLPESIKQLLMATSRDFRVVFMRIACWYAELKLIKNLPLDQAQSLAQETLQIYAPIVHRLGMYRIKMKLEELSFQFLDPNNYQKIDSFLASFIQKQNSFYQQIGENFAHVLKNESINYEFSYRTKDIYSIYKKSTQQQIEFSKLYDLIACRIVVDSVANCYQVLGLVHAHYKPLPGRFKDYINRPKVNGYQSLHTTVVSDEGIVFEVQIRTRQMHANSEYGFAAHWNYKEKNKSNLENTENVKWLRQLLNNFDDSTNLEESLQKIKRELYSNNIYVFTPNGKMIKLPVGSTVLDFAYHIHSEIGNRCTGGKINGRFSSIKTKLENGQQIEVVTSPNCRPNTGWLKICITNRALQHIRSEIRQQSMSDAEKIGQKALTKALDKLGMSIDKAKKHPIMLKYLHKKSFNSFSDLLKAIGYGNSDTTDLIKYFKSFEEPEPKTTRLKRFLKLPLQFKNKTTIIDKALPKNTVDGIPTRIANCCQPTRGDELVAFIDNSKFLKIHRTDCANVSPDKINVSQLLHINWDFEVEDNISVRLNFDFVNQIEILNKITNTLAKLQIKIESASTKLMANGKMRFSVDVNINNLQTIEKIKEKFNKYNDIKLITDSL